MSTPQSEALTRSRVDHWLRNRGLRFETYSTSDTVDALVALLEMLAEYEAEGGVRGASPAGPDVEAARNIAQGYEKAPCFAALLGEVDPEHPCGCPSCGLAAIRLALGAGTEAPE